MTVLVCNGRRVGPLVAAELTASLRQLALSELMRREGYTLRPVRAPRGLTNGELLLRLTWSKTEANATLTVRSTVRLRPPK